MSDGSGQEGEDASLKLSVGFSAIGYLTSLTVHVWMHMRTVPQPAVVLPFLGAVVTLGVAAAPLVSRAFADPSGTVRHRFSRCPRWLRVIVYGTLAYALLAVGPYLAWKYGQPEFGSDAATIVGMRYLSAMSMAFFALACLVFQGGVDGNESR